MEHMEEVQEIETPVPQNNVCAQCQTPLGVPAPRTPLCPECRNHLIKFPIPLWIKAFGGGILLTVLFCLYTFPKNVRTGIHFKKGMVATEQRHYLTAQREFAEVVSREPKYLEAQCRLLVAAYYNDDAATMFSVYPLIEGKNIEDDALYGELNNVLSASSRAFPSDSFSLFLEAQGVPADSVPVAAYLNYLSNDRADDFARVQLASVLFNGDQYAAADSLLDIALRNDPAYRLALVLKIPVKRDLLQFDSAYYYADKILATNQEHTYILAAKARVLLKQKKDKEALELAKKCYSLNETDGYTLATLAMAYHYNQDLKNRDAVMAEAEKDTTATHFIAVAKDIISGKENFRN